MSGYDSRPDNLRHALRVGELMNQVIAAALPRTTAHDLSKTQSPEVQLFDQYTPQLRRLRYLDDDGNVSDEYRQSLNALGPALEHHYANNRHHPEHFGEAGIGGMTLIDVVEMLADWKAAGERMTDGGDLARSIEAAKTRFGLSDQLASILLNTAEELGWIPTITATDQEGQ